MKKQCVVFICDSCKKELTQDVQNMPIEWKSFSSQVQNFEFCSTECMLDGIDRLMEDIPITINSNFLKELKNE